MKTDKAGAPSSSDSWDSLAGPKSYNHSLFSFTHLYSERPLKKEPLPEIRRISFSHQTYRALTALAAWMRTHVH